MAAGIRLAISELMGLGQSQRRDDAVKTQFLLTDGFPTLPIGGGRRVTSEDTDFAINAARISGKAGIKVQSLPWERKPCPTPKLLRIAQGKRRYFHACGQSGRYPGGLENLSLVG